jgi:acetyl esterase/lipase
MSGPTLATKDALDPLIHKTYLGELAAAYLGATARQDPRVSALFADLTGMPPTLIQVGSAETLLDDSVRLAGKAGATDVRVTLEIWPHMIHAWHLWNARLEPGRQALDSAGTFMRRYL